MPASRWLLLCAGVLACDRSPSVSSQPAAAAPAQLQPTAAGDWVVFEGACDASGAVPLDGRRFAVADDEDSVLRIYDAWKGGPPEARLDVADAIGLEKKGKKKGKKAKKKNAKPKSLESDIEAAAHIGQVAYWLTSHALKKSGKRDPNRFRFFATELPHDGMAPHVIGEPSTDLLDQMLQNEALAALGLAEASRLPAKADGALNLEGMTATPEGTLLIGFRSPQPKQRALVVSLHNPRAVLDGEPAAFGAPLLLDLGGLGIRAMSSWRGRYLIVAGPTANTRPSELYVWDGSQAPRRVGSLNLEGFNPEGFFTPESGETMLLLSDDGAREIQGKACKRLKDPALKQFRGRRVDLKELAPWLPGGGRASTSTGPSSAGPSSAGPSSAGPSSAGPSSAGPSSAGPSSAGPSSAGPSSAGPSSAGPSSTAAPVPEPVTTE